MGGGAAGGDVDFLDLPRFGRGKVKLRQTNPAGVTGGITVVNSTGNGPLTPQPLQAPPAFLKECAFVVALQTILTEYRKFIAYAPNL